MTVLRLTRASCLFYLDETPHTTFLIWMGKSSFGGFRVCNTRVAQCYGKVVYIYDLVTVSHTCIWRRIVQGRLSTSLFAVT